MFTQRKLVISLSLVFFTASAKADPQLSAVTVSGQFGIVNATTGAFNQIGPATADPLGGLVPASYGGYLGVSFAGNLDSVNPANGAVSVIGPTGLGYSALDTAELGGRVYETDFSNNLYTINTATGAATLIAPTGIPGEPAGDECDEALFTANGKLYATFDAFNATTFAVAINPELYQIDPLTGAATLLGSTSLHLNAALDVNGTIYAFQGQPSTQTSDVLSLDLATGTTTFLANIPSATFIDGAAAAAPEPASLALAGIGIAALGIYRRRRRQ